MPILCVVFHYGADEISYKYIFAYIHMHKSHHFYDDDQRLHFFIISGESSANSHLQCHRSQLKFTRTRKKITYQIYWKIAIMAVFSSMDHDQEDPVSILTKLRTKFY